MEEIREEKVSQILSWLQAAARGKMSRKTYKKLQQQKVHNKKMQHFFISTSIIFFQLYLTVGFVLYPEDNQEFHDWKNLAMVAIVVENQTQFEKCKICWN